MKFEEVLEVNLVLAGISLLNTTEEASAFRRGVRAEVRASEAVSGSEMIHRSYMMSRDRVVVTVTPDRSIIARVFPSLEALERLAEIASIAIDKTDLADQELLAMGYNIDFVYEPSQTEPAIRYLATRLFSGNLFEGGERQLVGGAGRLYFDKGSQHWQAVLEPRLNHEATPRIFVSLNLSIEEPSLPTKAVIKDSLKSLWAEAQDLVNQIHRSNKS